MTDLQHLVTSAQAGDTQAFGYLVRRFQQMAHGYACGLLGDVHSAEDATQDAFVEAFDRLPSLDFPLAFPKMLRRLVLKHCDRQTRTKHPVTVACDFPDTMTAEGEPSQHAERRDIARHLRLAIQGLPEHQREITALFYLGEASQQDISSFLGVPLATTKSRLQTARRSLKCKLLTSTEEAIRQNFLDDRFANNVIVKLLAKPRLLQIHGHPIRQLWDSAQVALRDYERVHGKEIENVFGQESEVVDLPFHISDRDILRTTMTRLLLRSAHRRSPPIKLLTAGRVFRRCTEGDRSSNVFHQMEGLEIGVRATADHLRDTVDRLLRQLLDGTDVRWLRVSSDSAQHAYRIAIDAGGDALLVGSAEVLAQDVLSALGHNSREVSGFIFRLGLDRLAMRQTKLHDIRDLWRPPFCPVVHDFELFDMHHHFENASSPLVEVTPISGYMVEPKPSYPGTMWMSQDDVVHLRGQRIENQRIEGDWDGAFSCELNMDLNQAMARGGLRNKAVNRVKWSSRGRSGIFSGVFTAEIIHGGVWGTAEFRGAGGFAGMKAFVQVRMPEAGGWSEYQGVVVEPLQK